MNGARYLMPFSSNIMTFGLPVVCLQEPAVIDCSLHGAGTKTRHFFVSEEGERRGEKGRGRGEKGRGRGEVERGGERGKR